MAVWSKVDGAGGVEIVGAGKASFEAGWVGAETASCDFGKSGRLGCKAVAWRRRSTRRELSSVKR